MIFSLILRNDSQIKSKKFLFKRSNTSEAANQTVSKNSNQFGPYQQFRVSLETYDLHLMQLFFKFKL